MTSSNETIELYSRKIYEVDGIVYERNTEAERVIEAAKFLAENENVQWAIGGTPAYRNLVEMLDALTRRQGGST